jgi:RES domain
MCVTERFLSAQIEKDGASATCSYCKDESNTFSVDQVADSVGTILADFYLHRFFDPEIAPAEGELLQQIISELAGVADGAFAEDVRTVLAGRYAAEWGEVSVDDNPFGPDVRYVRRSLAVTWDFESDWFDFERSLKTETRYFNKHAEHVLASIFEGIDQYRTTSERPVIVEAGPGTGFSKLYRAREFQAEPELREAMKRPDLKVGPPPSEKAVAGRMNAAGVAVFYGATDPDVALAEVRPPVGCKVLIGCFEVIRPLRLLDLPALNELRDDSGSLFDDAHRRWLKRAHFLRGLSWRLSRPVLPNDQPTEYLPTQAIADFLATAESPPLPLDGIVYPSVQAGYTGPFGRSNRLMFGGYRKENFNVVLFHKAATVLRLDESAVISVSDNSAFSLLPEHLDNGPDVEYTVLVAGAEGPSRADDAWDNAALKFSSMKVCYVKDVRFDTVCSSIPRYWTEDREQNAKG